MHEKTKNKYNLRGIDFSIIRNRNEVRVIEELKDILGESIESLSEEELSDIYALTLNNLPARYAQAYSVVLRDPVSQEAIRQAVSNSIDYILKHPKG